VKNVRELDLASQIGLEIYKKGESKIEEN